MQDRLNTYVWELHCDGRSDQEIVAELSDSLNFAIQAGRWGTPYMDALLATLPKIKRNGSRVAWLCVVES